MKVGFGMAMMSAFVMLMFTAGLAQSEPLDFSFVEGTALVVVPVRINGQGPYKFLLDTGATNTILSTAVADKLKLKKDRDQTLRSAGGNVPATIRGIDRLHIGKTLLEKVEIVVANFDLLQSLRVDGILGGDYLRRFRVAIDYEKQIVEIEPGSDSMAMIFA
jgi:predicted aspartyl protease